MRDDTREGRPQHLVARPMSTVSRTRPTAFQGRGKHLPAQLRRHQGSQLTRRNICGQEGRRSRAGVPLLFGKPDGRVLIGGTLIRVCSVCVQSPN